MLKQSAARAATEVLDSYWWEPSEPYEWQVPVDPFAIASDLGVDVYVADLKPDVSGAIRRRRTGRPVIYIKRGDAHVRQRFTCAHELGHYKQRIDSGDAEFEFVDFRGTLASTGTHSDEIYANQFAAELLMPKDVVKTLKWQGVDGLAATFNVSSQAMGLRLRNLGLG
jgi:Zn-dependent peptidase ImmA (M78 family)